MTEENIKSPSDIALAKLREKVSSDSTLPDAIKFAVLSDLSAADPSAFLKLKAVVSLESKENETSKT